MIEILIGDLKTGERCERYAIPHHIVCFDFGILRIIEMETVFMACLVVCFSFACLKMVILCDGGGGDVV